MQTQNQFLDFAEQVMARYQGFNQAFEPVSMVYLEDQEDPETGEAVTPQNLVTNLYHIQNIKEENYLYRQNLSFVTQILEKRIYQKLYPSVEQQIEKVVREEMPEAEEKLVKSFSQQLYRLVERGGIRQFEVIRDKILSEYHQTEKTTSREQEVLFRKIENIWNSSVYVKEQHKHVTLLQPETTRYVESSSGAQREVTVLEHGMELIKEQSKLLVQAEPQKIGNLGLVYDQPVESHVEDIRQIRTEEDVQKIVQRTEIRQRETEQIRQKELAAVSLTYLEETQQQESSDEQVEVRTHTTEEITRTEHISPIHPEEMVRQGEIVQREEIVQQRQLIQQVQPLESHVEDIRQVRTEEAVEKLLQKTEIRQTETEKILESLHTENVHTERHQTESEQIKKRELDAVSLTYLEEMHPGERSGEPSGEQTEVRTRTTEETTRAEQLTPIQQVKPLESHVEDIRQVRTEEAVEKLLQKTEIRQTETEKILESLHTENVHTERHQLESEQIQKKELETVSLTYLEETHPEERSGELSEEQTEVRTRTTEETTRAEQLTPIQQVKPLESHVEDIRQVRTEEAVEKLLQKTDIRQTETKKLLESLHTENVHTERHQTESEQIKKKELETVSLTYLEETHPGETTRTEQITPIQTEETVRHDEVVQREEITQQRKLIQQVQPLESHVEDIRQVRTEEAVEKLLQKTDLRQLETERLLESLHSQNIHIERHQTESEQIQKKELETVSLTYLEETHPGETTRTEQITPIQTEETVRHGEVVQREEITQQRKLIQQVQPLESHVEDIRQVRTEEAVEKLLQKTDVRQTETERLLERLQTESHQVKTEQIQKKELDAVSLTYLEETLSGEQAARPGEVSAEPSKEQTEVRTYKTEDVIRTEQITSIQQAQPIETHVEDIRQVRIEEAVEKLLQKTDIRQTETERLLESIHAESVHTESHQVKTEEIQKRELDAVSLTYLEETQSGEGSIVRQEQLLHQKQSLESHITDIRQIRTEEAVQKLLQRTDILQTQTEQVQKREQDTVLLTYLEEHQDEISEEHQETIRQVQRNRQIWSIESLVPMQTNAQRMLQNINLHQIRTIKSSHHVQSVPMIEPAAIVYRSEEDLSLEQQEKTERLEHKVDEVVKNLRTVEEKTVVHKEEIIEQQKTVVREVLKNSPAVWTEGEGASRLRKEIQQSMEEQIVQNVDQLVNKVYRRLEDRLRTERGRRGLI